jgi:hypothetical protein
MNRIGLSQRALNDLMSLNLVFLDLIRARARTRAGAARVFGLAREIAQQVTRLGNAELVTVAACPFALCCFGDEGPAEWRGQIGREVGEPLSTGAWPTDAGRRRQFAAMALGMIRELSAQEPHAAAVFFGLASSRVEPYADIDLASIPRLAERAESVLAARLADHPWFWQELVAAAQSRSPARQRAIRDLGLQLTLQRALQVDGGRPLAHALCRNR